MSKEKTNEFSSSFLDKSVYDLDVYSESEETQFFSIKRLKIVAISFLVLALLITWYWATRLNHSVDFKSDVSLLVQRADIIDSQLSSQLVSVNAKKFEQQINYLDTLVRSNKTLESNAEVKKFRNALTHFVDALPGLQKAQMKIKELQNLTRVSISESSELLTYYGSNGATGNSLALVKSLILLHQHLTQLQLSYEDYKNPSISINEVEKYQKSLMESIQDLDFNATGALDAELAVLFSDLQLGLKSLNADFSKFVANINQLESARASFNTVKRGVVQLKRNIKKGGAETSWLEVINYWEFWLSLILFLAGLIFLAITLFKLRPEKTPVVLGLQETLSEQQGAILSLLDEISSLADGDLTIEAKVTDEFTGAIADSINFAVFEMRELVSRIKSAAVEIASAAETAVGSAKSVSSFNHKQAEEVSAAAKLMARVQKSMREMSQKAVNSSSVAEVSTEAAIKGNAAVNDTIKEMEAIRLQIQDTSKRIKRLGESSQRIGDIVALIGDIADQTNILSLNATIHSSSGGDEGRGFVSVSDEVQALAERAAEASTKIVDLVSDIQSDTNDAIHSMEKATQQVISGAKQADYAGVILREIEVSSKDVSREVDSISREADNQANIVQRVAEQVSDSSKLSRETSEKSQESANKIAKLMELSAGLDSSVSRFKLPE